MKVICIKNTSVLVKGSVYEVVRLMNSGNRSRSGTICVKLPNGRNLLSRVQLFTNMDGTLLDQKDWEAERPEILYIKDVRLLKKGDVVVCNSDNTKTFEYGKMYKIEDVLYKESSVTYQWSSTPRTVVDQKLKIQGYSNRWLSPRGFRHCSQQEKRSLSLDNLFEDKIPVITEFKGRKIDKLSKSGKNKIILSVLMSSMLDPNKNNLSTIDWALKKKGKFYDLTEMDISPFLNKKLSEIIKIFD